jgi:orotate phosphoribosyltransferase
MTRGVTTGGQRAPLVHSRGGVHALIGDPAPLLEEVAPGSRLVGVGPGGVLVGAWLAASARGDFAFYRREPKDHGTRRQIEGRHDASAWTVVHCGASDPDLLRAAGMRVAATIEVPVVEGTGDAEGLRGFALPAAPVAPAEPVRLGDAVELITGGEFVRSSGERVDYYYETLGAAHTYRVAAAFADALVGRPELVGGVMWGGCYLAAVAAVRTGARLTLIDPDGLEPAAELPRAATVAFFDDLVNTGTDMRRCEMLAERAGAGASFHALYGFRDRPRLEHHDVAVGHRLERA